MAYSPITSFSYHGSNRHMSSIDFYTREIGSSDITKLQKDNYLFHGIGMFLMWWYDNLIRYHIIELFIIYIIINSFF